MTTSEKKQSSLISHLEKISQNGVSLYLNGHSATPDEIADCCVNEEAVYMPDYVTDELGVLKEIRYDKITFN